jgi:predicted PurR-regulated permease PerM
MLGMSFLDLRVVDVWANMSQLILPFFVAIYLIISHQYMLDPLIALAGYSEYTLFDFNKIREKFVQKTLNRRAITVLVLFVILLTAVCCLFIFVPGKRL